jgi:hypothetical protein
MRLFSRGSEDEEGAFGQEVTGTSKHSDSYQFDEARPKRDFSGRRRKIPKRFGAAPLVPSGSLLCAGQPPHRKMEASMSMTYSSSTASSDVASYGGFVDALGGIATIVLAIIALAGVKPEIMVAIATVVFGAALLIQGGAMLTEFALIEEPEAESASTGGGLSALWHPRGGGHFQRAFDADRLPGCRRGNRADRQLVEQHDDRIYAVDRRDGAGHAVTRNA